jgi:hypothetical protein
VADLCYAVFSTAVLNLVQRAVLDGTALPWVTLDFVVSLFSFSDSDVNTHESCPLWVEQCHDTRSIFSL